MITSLGKFTSNQPLTSQASNNLLLQAWAKFKPPKIPEISVEKGVLIILKKCRIYYLIRSMNAALLISSLCNTTAITTK